MREGWTSTALKEVCAVDKARHSGSGATYVGLEHIESGTGSFIGSMEPAVVKSATFRFTPDHVLYGRLRPYLNKVLLPDFDGHCSSEIFPIKVNSALDRQYLYYWLTWAPVVEQIDKTSTGARMPRANINKLLEFELPLAPLSEQKRIVAILDEAFAGIAAAVANAEKNLTNSRELFVSILEATFNPTPASWEERRLSDLCTIKHGFAFKSQYFRSNGHHVVLTPGSFFESGGFRDRGVKNKFYAGEIPRDFVLRKDDFLFAMTEQAVGLLGSSLIVPKGDRYLHNQRLGLVQVRDGVEWHNEFFFHQFNTRAFRDSVQSTASGVKVRHTSPAKLGAIRVKHPSTKEEQERVASRLTELSTESRRLQDLYRQKLAALSELKQSLLQKAFSGELTSSPQPEIENALA
jgi:type I restriction enzyme S subunit